MTSIADTAPVAPTTSDLPSAFDLILRGSHGRLIVLKNGRYDNVPIEVVTSTKKIVNVDKYYNKERLRPLYTDFEMQPLFIMASD